MLREMAAIAFYVLTGRLLNQCLSRRSDLMGGLACLLVIRNLRCWRPIQTEPLADGICRASPRRSPGAHASEEFLAAPTCTVKEVRIPVRTRPRAASFSARKPSNATRSLTMQKLNRPI